VKKKRLKENDVLPSNREKVIMEKSIKMDWTKSTKGTHVYANNEPDTPVSTIYIKRSGLPDDAPKKISLTIEFEDNA